jgi:single-stranded-DNA-specific exonuclease
VELYRRPTVIISEGEDGVARASARSVSGLDIYAAVLAVGGLLTAYGGHAGAAGLSMPASAIREFRRAFARAVQTQITESVIPELTIDATLPWNEPSVELAEMLDVLAPFGEGNPPVRLVTQGLTVTSQRIFGRDQAHRRLAIRDPAGIVRDVIWWRGADYTPPVGQFDLVYQLKVTDFRGDRGLQIEYVDARTTSAPLALAPVPEVQVVDHRAAADPAALMEQLRLASDVVVWAEGYSAERSPGVRRDQLVPRPALVIWTPAPGPRELRAALEQVAPQVIHLFAVTTDEIDPQRFLPRLAGLIKHTLRHKSGRADLVQLAALTGQRTGSVRESLRLLEARGDIRILDQATDLMHIAAGDGQIKPGLDEIQARLNALLQETAAYRAFFSRAAPGALIQ